MSTEVEAKEQCWPDPIKCSDRLPERPGFYLVYCEFFSDWDRDLWTSVGWRGDLLGKRVTHWMPLPPLPEERC